MAKRTNARSRLRALLHEVEFVAGHDGFMRGKPEPELLFVAIAQDEERICLLQTSRRKLAIQGSFPCTAALANKLVINARVPRWAQHITLLCLGVENDGGKDVDLLAGALDDLSAWKTRATDSSIAAPFALNELSVLPPTQAPSALRVRVSYQGEDAGALCKKDDWIAASMVLLDATKPADNRWTMRLLSDDKKNDWKPKVELRL